MDIKRKLKDSKTEIGTALVVVILLIATFLPQIRSGLAFSYGYDMRQQYYPFFEEFRSQWYQLFNLKELPFYSWNMFLGNNFWASKMYYTVGDLFNYIVLPLKGMHYYDIRFLQTLLKFTVAAISSFCYLKKFYKSQLALMVGCISYAFSFWIIYYIGQPMFISFYSLVPLYFLGMECYLQDKKKILYIVMTSILLCINYYLFYTLSFLSVVYYIYRYYCLGKRKEDFLKETSILIGYYFVGVLMTMVFIYPAGLYMLSNNRIGEMEKNLFYPDIKIYFHMIQSFFAPNYMMDKSDLISVFSVTNYRYDEIPLWAGIMTTLLVPQFLTDQEQKFKKATLWLYIFFIAMFTFPVGGAILHGFSETSFRWLFFVIFINIFVMARYLENIEMINIKNLKISTAMAVGGNLLIVPLTILFTKRGASRLSFFGQYKYILFFGVILGVVSLFIIKKSKWKKQVIVVASCLAILLVSSHYRQDPAPKESNSWDYVNRRSTGLQTEQQELIKFLRENGENVDTRFYRFFVDYETIYASYSFNSSMLYGIKDLMTYDSTISPSIYDLKKISDADFFNQDWAINFQNPGLINFLCAEYALVLNETDLPHNQFELIGDYYGILVYKNLEVIPFGFTYSSVRTYQELIDAGENKTRQLANHVIVDTQEEKTEIKKHLQSKSRVSMEEVSYAGNRMSGILSTTDSSFMVIQLPYDEGWSVLINGENEKIYRVNGGMMGIVVPKGYSNIEMFFVPKGLKVGLLLSGVGIVIFGWIVYQDKKQRKKARSLVV